MSKVKTMNTRMGNQLLDSASISRLRPVSLEVQQRRDSVVSSVSSKSSITSTRKKSLGGQYPSRASYLGGMRDSPLLVRRNTIALTGLPTSLPVQPKKHKAQILLWTDLPVTAIDRLNESWKSDHIRQVLADLFALDNYTTDLKMGITMDLYFNTLQFSKNHSFSPEKTSAFFSIIKKLFEMCIETPFENEAYTQQYFNDLVLSHSVNCPPYSMSLFSPEDAMKINEHTSNTFFRHFGMYKYAFTPCIELDLTLNYVGIQPSSPSLSPETSVEEIFTSEPTELVADPAQLEEERKTLRDKLQNDMTELLNNQARVIGECITAHFAATKEALFAKISQSAEPTKPQDDNDQPED